MGDGLSLGGKLDSPDQTMILTSHPHVSLKYVIPNQRGVETLGAFALDFYHYENMERVIC